jgi:two-component system sensor histidine kinase KdpD
MPASNKRPDPDVLLRRLAQDSKSGRGKLKIFLGYCAGVGKTYAMLLAARRDLAQGRRVLVGLVETHGRPETEEMLAGLPVLARSQAEHRGVSLSEFDLKACLEAVPKPDLVLVDELAHTNVPGSRHKKRYQDIEELIAAGIDVYTCLNVQHLESLNDVVLQITGVRVRETLPDQVLLGADQIELVDLPGEDLLTRLKEGKVYKGPKAGAAADNFFRPGNLVALREVALRCAANRIDEDVVRYMQKRSIDGPWPVRERLLVAVGPSPLSERLIRSACRQAEKQGAEWLAVSVEGEETYTVDARERISAHLRLAASLGASCEQISGSDVAAQILDHARKHNVTQIIAGKPSRPGLLGKFSPDLVDRLIAGSGNIDVYIVSAEQTKVARSTSLKPVFSWSEYGWSTAWVLSYTLFAAVPLSRVLQPTNLIMGYLAVVCATATFKGQGAAIWASTLSVAIFDFLFVPPFYTFHVSDGQYIVTFVAFILVSVLISGLSSRARYQAKTARFREEQTHALLELSRDFGRARTLEQVAEALQSHLRRRFDEEATVVFQAREVPEAPEVADWSWQHAQSAGLHSDTLSEAPVSCLPIVSGDPPKTLGLVVLRRLQRIAPAERELLDTFLLQASVILERVSLSMVADQNEVLLATERLQSALLNSVSHDLRIPLVSIVGALQAIEGEDEAPLSAVQRRGLLDNALSEAERLNRLLGNLLQISSLDSGSLRLKLEPNDISDVISVLPFDVQIPVDAPFVLCDILLVQQVLINLLDNARKYAPGEEPRLEIETAAEHVIFCFQDFGPGIPASDQDKIFERFYRSDQSSDRTTGMVRLGNVAGTGLGLSICQGLIEAQGGRIWLAESQRGSRFCFSLPIANPTPPLSAKEDE